MRTFAGNEQDLFFLSVLAHTSRLLFEGELDLLLLASPLLQKIICICKQRPEAGGGGDKTRSLGLDISWLHRPPEAKSSD